MNTLKIIPIITLIVFGNLISQPSMAQKHDSENLDLVNQFFSTMLTKSSNDAVDLLFSTNPLKNEIAEQIQGIKSSINQTISLLGKSHGYEVTSVKKVGKSFELITAIAIYDRQPIRFQFSMYKPESKWKLLNLNFDDKIEHEAR